MILRPGAWLGLPAGWPDPVAEAPGLRLALVLLSLASGLLLVRRRRAAAIGGGLLFGVVSVLPWLASLARPYGLFLEPGRSVALCELAVSHELGFGPDGACVAGVAGVARLHGLAGAAAARLGLGLDLALALPTLLPALALVVLPLLVQALAPTPRRSLLPFFLVSGWLTRPEDVVAGVGVLSDLWRRPLALVALVAVTTLLLAACRRVSRARTALLVGGAVGAALALAQARGWAGPTLLDTLLLATVHQGVWLLLAGVGLWRQRDPAALATLSAGAVLLAAHALGIASGAWLGHGLYRLGLLLAAAAPLEELAEAAGRWLVDRRAALARVAAGPLELGLGLFVGLGLAGSLPAWWHPPRADVVFDASRQPVSVRLAEAMARLRRATPPDAILLASPEYAPAIGALAGRRLWRAPELAVSDDDEERQLLEHHLLVTGQGRRLANRLGISHVFVGVGDRTPGRWLETAFPPSSLRLVFEDAEGFALYAVRPPG